jgi:hypothetical protein
MACCGTSNKHHSHGFPISGSNIVDENFGTKKHPGYEGGNVHINPEQYFKDVPAPVWTHTIGGYQPAEKWLKDRRGRTLTTDDLRHYQRMLIAITETQSLMPQIDEAINTQAASLMHFSNPWRRFPSAMPINNHTISKISNIIPNLTTPQYTLGKPRELLGKPQEYLKLTHSSLGKPFNLLGKQPVFLI